MLLPAFHAVQDRVGWVSRGAMNYVCERLVVPPAEAWGVLTFYHLFATAPRPATVAHVCDDIACRTRGGEALCAALERDLGPAGASPESRTATWMRSPCLGQCDRAPAVLVVGAGVPARRHVLASPSVVDVHESLAAGRGKLLIPSHFTEGEGFEPSDEGLPHQRFSSPFQDGSKSPWNRGF